MTIAVARVIGETAPLLIICGATDSTNFNPFDGRMMTLPVYIYSQYKNPGFPPEYGIERAWGAALVLTDHRDGAQPRGPAASRTSSPQP